MLGIPIEKVCDFVERVKGFDATLPSVDTDIAADVRVEDISNFADEHADDTSGDEQGTTEYGQLKEFVDALNEEEQCNLVALAWLGRGTYDKSDWASALSDARDAHNDHTADYLLGIPLVGTYLEDGLAQLGYACV